MLQITIHDIIGMQLSMLRAYFISCRIRQNIPLRNLQLKKGIIMFTLKDISQIDRDYFVVNATTLYNICLVSKNTKHHWTIQPQTINGHRSIIVLHRHGNSGEYHVQPYFHPSSILQAQELIKSHDRFQINGLSPV